MTENLKVVNKPDMYDRRYDFLAGGVSSILFTFGYRANEDFEIQYAECYGEPIIIIKKDIIAVKVFSKLAEWVESFGLDDKLYIIKDSTDADRPSVDNNYITLMIR